MIEVIGMVFFAGLVIGVALGGIAQSHYGVMSEPEGMTRPLTGRERAVLDRRVRLDREDA